MKHGICPKCKEDKPLTRHHVFPKRFYKKSRKTLDVCRDCHSELEFYIPQQQKMCDRYYTKIIDLFLGLAQ